MTTETLPSLRDQIRAATIDKEVVFRSEIVSINGKDVEVREPSVTLWGTILEKSMDDEGGINIRDFSVWSVILCSFVPGTDEHVFSEKDFEAFKVQPKGGFIKPLEDASTRMISANPELVLKN